MTLSLTPLWEAVLLPLQQSVNIENSSVSRYQKSIGEKAWSELGKNYHNRHYFKYGRSLERNRKPQRVKAKHLAAIDGNIFESNKEYFDNAQKRIEKEQTEIKSSLFNNEYE